MKILKFNENIENWNKESIFQFIENYRYFTDKIRDFIFSEEEFDEDETIYINDIYRERNKIIVEYNDDSGNDLTHQITDLDELSNFMNNPELYKDTKKYNL